MTDLRILAERLDAIENPRQLKFGVYCGSGWITSSSESTVRLLCDIYNARKQIAAALRARASQEQPQ